MMQTYMTYNKTQIAQTVALEIQCSVLGLYSNSSDKPEILYTHAQIK